MSVAPTEHASRLLPYDVARFAILDLAPNGFLAIDSQWRVTYINAAGARLLGKAPAELLGKDVWKVIPDAVTGPFCNACHRAMNGGETVELESFYDPLGTWLQVRAYPIEHGIAVYFADITSQKRAEAELHAQTERLRIGQSVARLIVMDWDIRNDQLSWSDSPEWLRGPLPPGGKYPLYKDQVYPADRSKFLAMREKTIATMRGQSLDYRVVRTDATIIWVRSQHVVIPDADGKAGRLLVALLDITDRKGAEHSLRQAEERLRLVIEGSNDAPWDWDLETSQLYYSPRWWSMLGYAVDELPNDAGLWERLLHPEDASRIQAFFSATLAGTTATYEIEFRLRHKDGHYVPVLSRGYVLRNDDGKAIRASGVNTDLTERRRIDEARQQALDILQKIAARVPGVVYQFRMRPDGSSCFPYSSDAIHQIYRVAPGDVVHDASPVFAVLHPDDYDAVARSIEDSRRTLKPWRQEYRVKFNDGVVHWLLGNAVPELEDDGSVLWHGFITEISAQKEAERTRESLEEQLRESQKMEAVGTLAGGIAHDFNNIIGTILGNTELARQDVNGNPSALESLDEIRKAGERARALVRQILSFSRRQPTTRRVLALKPVVEDVVRLLKSTLLAPIAIECAFDPLIPEILADAIQVEQVLINVITNAAQAMDGKPGRILIDVELKELSAPGALAPHGLKPGDYALVTVSDSGPGMDAATLERVFEPFFTTKPVGAGTGLGLSVVYGIMQAHDGAVVAWSELGKGSSFALYFPAAKATAPTPETESPDSPESNAKAIGSRVLYIDDEESLTLLVKRLLGRLGHSVTCFVDAREALATLNTDAKAFDLVVTDYNMPAMNGIDVAIAVRKIRPGLPVAIASGFITDDLKAQASAIGVTDLIFKPNAVEEYCEIVSRLTQVPHKFEP